MTIHPDALLSLCVPVGFALIGLVLLAVCWWKGDAE